jgi:hypothetical protein
MLYPELEERLHNTKHALTRATSENIIERCKQYLALLAEYRRELYKLSDIPGINLRVGASSREDVESTRKAVRVAIEDFTKEHNMTNALLLSFTAVSGYEAAETLNKRKYKGHDTWELRASGVRFSDSADDRMTVQEAVETASLLRREEHIAKIAALAGTNRRACPGISNCEPVRDHEDSA